MFLVVFDVALDRAFAYPRREPPSRLQSFFEYGRSIEGKLERLLGAGVDDAAPIALAGWVHDPVDAPTSARSPAAPLVAVYGMSFTQNVVDAAQRLDPRLTVRFRGGPAAPANHSLACLQVDLARHEAEFVVLGILSSSLPAIHTQTGLTWTFEAPFPYFYPSYTLDGGRLVEHQPPVRSLAELEAAFRDPARWGEVRRVLAETDPHYDDSLFRAGPSDRSSLLRIVRRARAQRIQAELTQSFFGQGGRIRDPRTAELLRAIVRRFVEDVRGAGRTPVLLLSNAQGSGGGLREALEPAIAATSVAVLDSNDFADPGDRSNYQADSHFTPAVDARMGGALLDVLDDVSDSYARPTGE